MKICVLNSGGLDSSVCTAYAVDKYGRENVVTASLFYGQRHQKELECAEAIAKHYRLAHYERDISSVFADAGNVCSLMQGSDIEMAKKSYAEQIAESGKPNTEVPMRNGLFLLCAASMVMSLFPDEEVTIIYGAHADDAAGNAYPDCSPEFAELADKLIQVGSRDKVHLERPLINMNKAGVVKLGLELNVPFAKTWSCYEGGAKACGRCGTCIDRIAAFKANGVIDPIDYGIEIDWSGCKTIKYLQEV